MSGVRRGGTARRCVRCPIKKNDIHLLETADKGSGAEMDRIYSVSEQLRGQFELLFKHNK